MPLFLLVLPLALWGSAQAAPILSIAGPTTVTQGQSNVVYDIDVADDGGGIDIGGADLYVTYDPSVFAYVSAAAGSLIGGVDTFSANDLGTEINLSVASLFGISSAGNLGQITFDVLSDAPLPGTSLTFDTGQSSLLDSGFQPVVPDYAGLDVAVTGAVPAPGAALLLPLGLLAMRAARMKAVGQS
ncbi:cohesin domain-containing protein [uncultured Thiohalocapsa sp.]|uniref:cohesin domain-containing protein n=1 Tax=uncultured Thiohalocapsa sp. TaxID=768990 RepID=UPI0025F751F2|nr:cohesin domain-containing protein [uncultured Thiohalocapsa sp.]